VFTAVTFLLITGAVFFFTLVILGVLASALARYKERYVARSVQDFSDMFLFVDAEQIIVLNVCMLALAAGLGFLLGGPLLGALAGGAGFFAPQFLVRYYRRRRIRLFEQQLVEVLQQMSGALKAGLTFAQSMEGVAKEAPVPLGQEFGLFVKEVKLGVPLDEALLNMARRVGSEDMDLVATSTNIARSLGGNMAEMFETIAATIRERFRLEGKIRALTSQGRLQGLVVGIMPIVIGLVINWLWPHMMQPMFQHWFGWVLVLAIAIMEMLGILLIRRIVNIDV
jgi:tight adherence protein B